MSGAHPESGRAPLPSFFIIGSARSGTTLLRIILNAHPDIAVPPESRFVVELYSGSEEIEVASFLRALGSYKRFRAWDLPIAAVAEELAERASVVRYPIAVGAAYRAYARSRSKSIAGDKTPRYIEHIPLLAHLFPRARFIHIVRDGRNVALSYADVPFGPQSVVKAAALWSSRVSVGLASGRALGPDRYLEIRYEDFVAGVEKELKKVCNFIGASFDPGMLDYSERSADAVLPRAAQFNPHLTEGIGEVRSWQEQMPPRFIELFEAVAGDVLSALGYERRFPAPRPLARALASMGRLGLPVGRLRAARRVP